jgi:hypothetical protein
MQLQANNFLSSDAHKNTGGKYIKEGDHSEDMDLSGRIEFKLIL